MFAPAPALAVSDRQKAEIEALVRNGNTPQRVARRGQVVLLAQQGVANHAIAQRLQPSRPSILALRVDFAKNGIAAITGVRKRSRSRKV